MASKGAIVSAIDASKEAIEIARLQQMASDSKVEYFESTAECFAENHAGQFDVITCMEMLEHVPSPASVIAACAQLVKPGGMLFFSTLNRTAKSYLHAVLGAEYVLNLLPKGTHDYAKFIKPSEMAADLRANDLELLDLSGMSYNPLNSQASLTAKPDVNYLICAQRPHASSGS
jgi:2-polyprenyl-6-hydroxyphenyl methylase/3-demethylubiquinone-9 3-methyltransferase